MKPLALVFRMFVTWPLRADVSTPKRSGAHGGQALTMTLICPHCRLTAAEWQSHRFSYTARLTNRGTAPITVCSLPDALLVDKIEKDGRRIHPNAVADIEEGIEQNTVRLEAGRTLEIEDWSLVDADVEPLEAHEYDLGEPGEYRVSLSYRCGKVRLRGQLRITLTE